MKKSRLAILAISLVLILTGCISSQYSGLSMGINTSEYSELGDFATRVLTIKFLGVGGTGNTSLFNINARSTDTNVKQAIAAEQSALGGDAVTNITLVSKSTFPNMLITILTLGIIAPTVTDVSGTVIAKP